MKFKGYVLYLYFKWTYSVVRKIEILYLKKGTDTAPKNSLYRNIII